MTSSSHPTAGHLAITFIASGSRGNCTAVCSENDVILVDTGVSAREARKRLAAAGIDEHRVRAILLTHEHTDHVAGVRVLARHLGVPVIATEGTIRAASACLADVAEVCRVRPDDDFMIGDLHVRAFTTSHDAADPVGYSFETARGTRFGLASDTGHVPSAALEVLETCDMVGLESNHDVTMLETGPYPGFLKRRILSRTGHLSNEDAALTLERLADKGVRSVCALHLSEQNNTPDLVERTLRGCVDRMAAAVDVMVASQYRPLTCAVRR